MSSTEFSWHPVKENTGQFDVKKHGNTLLLGMPFWGMVSYTQASKGVKCFYVSFSESIQSRAPPETLSSEKILKVQKLPTKNEHLNIVSTSLQTPWTQLQQSGHLWLDIPIYLFLQKAYTWKFRTWISKIENWSFRITLPKLQGIMIQQAHMSGFEKRVNSFPRSYSC